jgi:hypothetical protein
VEEVKLDGCEKDSQNNGKCVVNDSSVILDNDVDESGYVDDGDGGGDGDGDGDDRRKRKIENTLELKLEMMMMSTFDEEILLR